MAAITFSSNTASLTACRRLAGSTAGLEMSLTRLSTGLRINRAADDAAGLAVSAALHADRAVMLQGVRNLNDGISYLSLAEGAAGELKGVLHRMQELAAGSANGTLGATQRSALDAERRSLTTEYNRIVRSTSFNDIPLFGRPGNELVLQAGFTSRGASGSTSRRRPSATAPSSRGPRPVPVTAPSRRRRPISTGTAGSTW